MALTKISRSLLDTGISDSSDATAITINSSEQVAIKTDLTEGNIASFDGLFTVKSTESGSHNVAAFAWEHGSATANIEQRISWAFGDDATADSYGPAGYIGIGKQGTWQLDADRDSYMSFATTANNTASEQLRLTSEGNLHLSGGSDRRIQLGSGGAGANSTSNDTVHIRGDGDNLKMMMAADGQMVIEQNGSERLRVNALGVLSNKSANHIIRTEAQSFLTLGDDSSVTLFLGTAGSTLLSVYEGGSGSGALVWLNYSESSGGNFLKSGGVYNFSSSDTDGQICVIKSANSHTATVKNRTGAARNFALAMYGAKIDSSNS